MRTSSLCVPNLSSVEPEEDEEPELEEPEEEPEEEPVEEEPEEEADDALPQTGQNWAATALLALGGMFVTAAGWIRRKSEENA